MSQNRKKPPNNEKKLKQNLYYWPIKTNFMEIDLCISSLSTFNDRRIIFVVCVKINTPKVKVGRGQYVFFPCWDYGFFFDIYIKNYLVELFQDKK